MQHKTPAPTESDLEQASSDWETSLPETARSQSADSQQSQLEIQRQIEKIEQKIRAELQARMGSRNRKVTKEDPQVEAAMRNLQAEQHEAATGAVGNRGSITDSILRQQTANLLNSSGLGNSFLMNIFGLGVPLNLVSLVQARQSLIISAEAARKN